MNANAFGFIVLLAALLALICPAVAEDWHAYTGVSPDVLRGDALRLSESEKKTDRVLAADLLARFPLYFSSEIYLSLAKRFLLDKDREVRKHILSAMFEVADGGFPTETMEKQKLLLKDILDLLKSVRSKSGNDIAEIDELSKRIKSNPLLGEAKKGVGVRVQKSKKGGRVSPCICAKTR